MCGIIAGIAQREMGPILLEGLKRLEYRGYDSAGLALLNHQGLKRLRTCGKVNQLVHAYAQQPILGKIGIAHTRWATHGQPNENNAHPHFFENKIALVHNGIIENYLSLRHQLAHQTTLQSQTDTEVIVQWIGTEYKKSQNLLKTVQATVKNLLGAYSFALISEYAPDRIIVARHGSPLVIGIGVGEHLVASDSLALLPFTQNFVVLEEGDVAEIFTDRYVIYDSTDKIVERKVKKINLTAQSIDRGQFRHYMQKEIFEQPQAVRSALAERLDQEIREEIFGANASEIFKQVKAVQIVACGTSYHAGLVAKHWLEQITGLFCQAEIASEIRHRRAIVMPGTLFVTLSQSGETADTLAALKMVDENYCGKLTICNVAESSLVRESELVLLTHAGPEIGVASTKAFTTQLVCLLMLIQCLKRYAPAGAEQKIVQALRMLPQVIEQILQLDKVIAQLAQRFDDTQHALFIGRGIYYPIAQEGALKLKEISYIHAEAYPAGELKHGPLALVDKHMPVVALVAKDKLLDKLISNLQEVRARQGALIIFAEKGCGLFSDEESIVVEIPLLGELLAPFAFTVLLQLLAYHVAVRKGTDVDQPRNLAKSVTVE